MQQEPSLNQHAPPSGPIDAANRRFMRLLGDEGGPLLKVWLIFAVFSLFVNILSAGIQISSNQPMLHEIFDPAAMQAYPPPSLASSLSGLLLYPFIWLMMSLYFSTFAAVKLVDERSGDVSFGEARKAVFANILPTALATLVFGLVSGFGTLCCILPGFVAMFFLYLSPYLVAARGESVGQSLSMSVDWAKRHWIPLTVLMGIGLTIGLGTGLITFVALAGFGGAFGKMGILYANVTVSFMTAIIGYFAWLYSGSILVTIDRAES